MNIQAYCALHYGAEWLEWAIRSVIDFVDRYHIFYTPHPSHGQSTTMTVPDKESRDALRAIAAIYGNEVVWHDVDHLWNEGDQRDYCVQQLASAGSDIVVWNDADEVWDPDVLCECLDAVAAGSAKDYRVHAMHFWKSVNWVCYDDCMPVRFIKPSGSGEAFLPGQGFYHFGYAQSSMLVAYKSKIHGHRNEWRRNWWGTIYNKWEPGQSHKCGVHPTNECDDKTGKPFWTPVPFDRYDIEDLIGDHPYFSDEII